MAAAKEVYPPPDFSKPFDFGRHAELVAWAPTVDGVVLPESPFRDHAPAISANVPMIVGTTRTEFGIGCAAAKHPDRGELSVLTES
jgi:hypothetical protein